MTQQQQLHSSAQGRHQSAGATTRAQEEATSPRRLCLTFASQ